MKKKLSTVPFQGTPEQKAKLLDAIHELQDQKGCLMPIMQAAQDIYGYLPLEVQSIIAEELGISVEEVYGVSTFYSQFNLSPQGKYKISVCLGTACYVKGSQAVLDKIEEVVGIHAGECTSDAKFSIEACRCIGACGLAPVFTVNDDVYGRLTADDVPAILAKYE